MSILQITKKGFLYAKTAAGYVKTLPRTLAELVTMKNGNTVEDEVTDIKAKTDTLKTGAFSTVVNNATTTTDGTVLDGRMGKTLKDDINTLNSALVVTGFRNIGATSLADAVFKAHSQLLTDGKSINAQVSYISGDTSNSVHIMGSRLYANRGRYIACSRTNDDAYIFRITTESTMVYYKIQTDPDGYTYP